MHSAAWLYDWPPSHLPLAPRVFPERAEQADTALDRWVAGMMSAVHLPSALRGHGRDAVVRAVLKQERGLKEWDDARLLGEAREAAVPAFMRCDPESGARAIAIVREVARRRVGLLAHPPQVAAAWKLLCGRLVELDTGEGKTLSAALAACLAALARVPTHVITVNDYLAQRDAQTMGPLFAFFGLSVGVVHSKVAHNRRAAEYSRSLTYCTNKDLVFDYLRDRVNARGAHSLAQLSVRQLHGLVRGGEPLRLRGLHFAIVDEADSILIDEGRTPLILSAARDKGRDHAAYQSLLDVAGTLEADLDFRMVGPLQIPELTEAGRERLDDITQQMGIAKSAAANPGQEDPGSALVRTAQRDESPADPALAFWQVPWVRDHYIVQALRALHVLQRDHHYVVQEGKVVIVDEFTGRLLPDRSWEQGLHQLIEAKESCAVTGVNRTLARLTYQNFFARYLRLSGMSGTLREVARETATVYRVRTERVEPNKPMRRTQWPTLLLANQAAKYQAVVGEVARCLARGQPVLVGTRSVEASQLVSDALRAAGISHRVLNALQTADEAELIARAGMPGAVTVATNMAGRGTDIPLDPALVERGGLHVVLTEWHESPRIDRQLFGRSARQGDPGSCRAIVSLEDEIIQRHSPGVALWVARRWPDGVPPKWAVRLLRNRVQAMAERVNAAQRRATMQHDRLMQTQLAFSGIAE
jgi:preprotein translocase subunit SecA